MVSEYTVRLYTLAFQLDIDRAFLWRIRRDQQAFAVLLPMSPGINVTVMGKTFRSPEEQSTLRGASKVKSRMLAPVKVIVEML